MVVDDLQTRQQDRLIERRGPALNVAFDEDGNPTQALQGFARSCGAEVADLEKLHTDKGTWLVCKERQKGAKTASLIATILQQAILALPIAKRMRWGSLPDEFVRPVHWLIVLFGDDVIPLELLGAEARQESQGHRFHHPSRIFVQSPKTYISQLANQGYVLADMAKRRDTIISQVSKLAAKLNGKAILDEALLDEVTALVEWLFCVIGFVRQTFFGVTRRGIDFFYGKPSKIFCCARQTGQFIALFYYCLQY